MSSTEQSGIAMQSAAPVAPTGVVPPASVPPSRDEGNWARNIDRLAVPEEVSRVGYNLVGRRLTGPQQGFGRLWQRTYWVDLGTAATPEAVIAEWRAHFGDYWPKGGVFHASLTGIQPGSVAALQVGGAHGPKVATGIFVLYADEESFSFLTPEGHMFAGMITFSAETVESGTRAIIRILIRPNDPLWELAWPVARRKEDVFWSGTLQNLAASHGIFGASVSEQTECLDRRRIWVNWRNVKYNAAIRSALHPFAGLLHGRAEGPDARRRGSQ
jgi:hypothetical protein